ncbi:MAG: lipocalin-like domain-containing protein [Tannerella sp.]|jgi:hypothetical protein|nr:lipocalin-like domain-containing protein [Tannerella sp.]
MIASKIFVLFVFLFFLTACEKIEIPSWAADDYLIHDLSCFDTKIKRVDIPYTSDNPHENIVGKWQLLVDTGTGDKIDYSCNSIFYNFNENGMVTIQSDVKEISNSTFRYNYHSDPFCPSCLPTPNDVQPNLVIGDSMYYCQVAMSKLTIYSVLYDYPSLYDEPSLNEDVALRRRGEVVYVLFRK